MVSATIGLILFGLLLGTFSSLLFVWQWSLGAPPPLTSWFLLAVVVVVFCVLFFYLRRRLPKAPQQNGKLLLPFVLVLGYSAFLMIECVKASPLGGADARAVWNLHARFLYRGGAGAWRDMFIPSLGWTQNDYPLLTPTLIAGSWRLLGHEAPVTAAAIGVGFMVLGIGIVATSLSALSNDQRGWMASLLLVGTPSIIIDPSGQGADLPLGLYIMLTIILVALARSWPEVKTPLLVLAGLSAGFAGWTKNDGLLFILVFLGSHFLIAALRRDWREYPKEVFKIGLGLAPILLLIGSFKMFLAPPGDYPLDRIALEKLVTGSRYSQVSAGFIDGFKAFGGLWNDALHPGTLLVLFLLLYVTSLKKVRSDALYLLLTPMFMAAGYFMLFIITPYELKWHMDTSLDRLLLQLWPATVFILGTISATAKLEDDRLKDLPQEAALQKT